MHAKEEVQRSFERLLDCLLSYSKTNTPKLDAGLYIYLWEEHVFDLHHLTSVISLGSTHCNMSTGMRP